MDWCGEPASPGPRQRGIHSLKTTAKLPDKHLRPDSRAHGDRKIGELASTPLGKQGENFGWGDWPCDALRFLRLSVVWQTQQCCESVFSSRCQPPSPGCRGGR